jgi:hypothetical protein
MLLQCRWPQTVISSKLVSATELFRQPFRLIATSAGENQIVTFPLAIRPILVHRNSADNRANLPRSIS